jgi:hypothetical protein
MWQGTGSLGIGRQEEENRPFLGHGSVDGHYGPTTMYSAAEAPHVEPVDARFRSMPYCSVLRLPSQPFATAEPTGSQCPASGARAAGMPPPCLLAQNECRVQPTDRGSLLMCWRPPSRASMRTRKSSRKRENVSLAMRARCHAV